ncbi:flagellar motor protein MotA [Nisaea acidiphila]|uniref:Flagellar motor protein MotA n=1 Tax=Nisaea acidiphila TaxID=1862145 RepID=A0A9J7AWR6_9PROT|nr:flagellar motor protein MotA [Nisaea acidiphila]UUX51736.1 flagellar motor protein MotA [Nisaea acidiphila]
MTKPTRFLVRMAIFLLLVSAVAVLLFAPLFDAFMANAALNGMILATLVIGILYIARQVASLGPEVSWIESYRTSQPGLSVQQAPTLLAPVATMLGEKRDDRVSLSAMSLRSLLDSIDARLAESRDISRYIIGLLIFLGLLGTFWGLLQTVGAVGNVINSLSVESGDLGTVFDDLKTGLESPLGGMATAFSSSLFGLAGSLILGFLELQLGQAQNRFYNDLEEWLSGLTRLSSGGGVLADGEHSASAYQTALWEQTADSLDKLQRVILRSEDDRRQANANLMALNEKLGTLVDQMRAEQDLMVKLGEAQLEIRPVLAKIAEGQGSGGRDELMRSHLRNIEAYVARLVEEASEGRSRTVEEIRQEIRLVARTIAALAEEEQR